MGLGKKVWVSVWMLFKSPSVLELLSQHVSCGRKCTLKGQAGGEATSLQVVLRNVDMTLRAAGRKWRPVIWKDRVLRGLIYSSIF